MTQASFQPDWAIPPGATILDILRGREMSEGELADLLDRSGAEVRDLIEGRLPITLRLARQLQEILGASVEFWMARDHLYRAASERIHEREREWLRDLPLSDMVRFGWLSPAPKPANEAAACLDFFDVQSVQAWTSRYLEPSAMAAFRTSPSFDSRPGSVAAWLRQGARLAEQMDCREFDKQLLRDSLPAIRDLTREKDPEQFVPEARRLLANAGVVLAIVKTPAGCSASGAAFFLSPMKAAVLLSFRYLSDDHFWFSFFHEIAHLILHADEGLFVDGGPTPSTPKEDEANEFAALVLIPEEQRREMDRLALSAKAIIRFARKAGVSPGVVVGQLQHSGRVGFDHFNGLKRRYEWRE